MRGETHLEWSKEPMKPAHMWCWFCQLNLPSNKVMQLLLSALHKHDFHIHTYRYILQSLWEHRPVS